MNYLFKPKDIVSIDPTRTNHFFTDFIEHVFCAPNLSPEHGPVTMAIYLIPTMESSAVETHEVFTNDDRLNFFDKVSQGYLNSCYGAIYDLSTGGNRAIFTFQEGKFKQLLITVDAHNSLLYVKDNIDIIPQLKIKLDQVWNIHISMCTYCYSHHLANVHPFQLESYRTLKGFIDGSVDAKEATQWFKRFKIYHGTCRSLLMRIGGAQDLINMNPNLLDLFEENVTQILEEYHLGKRLFPNQDKDHFYINLEHYMTHYNDIIERGLTRIKEL